MKVLVIRLSSLGDLVHATSVLGPLASACCEIHFVTKSSFAVLLQDHPLLQSVHAYDSALHGERAAREQFFQWVEAQRFDFVLDLHDSLRTRLWRGRLRKYSKVYVARKERLREIAILLFRLKKLFGFGPGGRAKKMRDLALRAIAEQGLKTELETLALTNLAIHSEVVLAMKARLPERFAVLLPGSAWPGKQWPYFAELAEKMAKEMPVVVLGGEKDLQCDRIAERAKQWNHASISLRGKTSLRESMAVLSLAEKILGNDTGMVHVAEALGHDVTVIEGPTEASLGFSPYRAGSKRIGLNLFCRPCSKSGKICYRWGSRKCLRGISSEEVLLR